MGTVNNQKLINNDLNKDQTKILGIIFLFLLLTSDKTNPRRLNFANMDSIKLEKKCRMLNRIKGYMSTEEQYIVHRVEAILEIMGKLKSLMEGPELFNAQVRCTSLSVEERKTNMLLDLSNYMKEEDRNIIHMAIDLDTQIRTMGKKYEDLRDLTNEGININNIEKVVEILEPFLEKESRSRIEEIRKIINIFRFVKAMDKKDSLDEREIIDAISPNAEPQHKESLIKMLQIAKAISKTVKQNDNKTIEKNGDSSETLGDTGQSHVLENIIDKDKS